MENFSSYIKEAEAIFEETRKIVPLANSLAKEAKKFLTSGHALTVEYEAPIKRERVIALTAKTTGLKIIIIAREYNKLSGSQQVDLKDSQNSITIRWFDDACKSAGEFVFIETPGKSFFMKRVELNNNSGSWERGEVLSMNMNETDLESVGFSELIRTIRSLRSGEIRDDITIKTADYLRKTYGGTKTESTAPLDISIRPPASDSLIVI